MDAMECDNAANENQTDQQENVPPNHQNVPKNSRANLSVSSSTDSKSIPMKKRKYRGHEVNAIYNNMQCTAMYMQQRALALQARNVAVMPPGPSSSGASSVPSGQRTPSPDFAPSAGHASSPLPAAAPQQRSPEHVQQQYYQLPGSRARHPAEHNYAVSSASSSTATAGSAEPARPQQPRAAPPARSESDSGNSSLNDSMINPLCITDWYKDLLKPEYLARLQAEHDLITSRSKAQKDAVIAAKIAELPEGPDYFPNKSRLRKEYDDPEQAAERDRNNQASRRSRFKKKRAQIILNMQLEFDRTENIYLFAMQNWIERIIFQLEASWLSRGASGLDLIYLRRESGFPQDIKNAGWLNSSASSQ